MKRVSDRCRIAPKLAVGNELTAEDVRWLRGHADLAGVDLIQLDARGCPPVERPSPVIWVQR